MSSYGLNVPVRPSDDDEEEEEEVQVDNTVEQQPQMELKYTPPFWSPEVVPHRWFFEVYRVSKA